MNWISKVERIVCLNLLHREDRFIAFTEQAEKYSIPFERVNAIYNEQQGAAGLRDTMAALFNEQIAKNAYHTLVFEDDASILVEPFWFHEYMNKVMEQLPENYHMVFLGCQLTNRVSHFHSPNLIPVSKAFSTHAVLYSLQGMKEIMARNFGYPIDNWMVDEIQTLGQSYCTFPLLCSQVPGVSDIGKNFIDWTPFIVDRYNQKVGRLK